MNYRTPGAYIEEVAKFPASVVPVATAIPVFFGFSQRTQYKGTDLVNAPMRITSLLEFEQVFGTAPPLGNFAVSVDPDGAVLAGVGDPEAMAATQALAAFKLHYAIRHFYLNGGGICYICSLGDFSARRPAGIAQAHLDGLAAVALEDEPTLLVMPDLSAITPADETAQAAADARAQYHLVLVQALAQCGTLGDRFVIGDLFDGRTEGQTPADDFRDGIGTSNLKYGAVYHPHLSTTLGWLWDEATITVSQLAVRQDDGTILSPSPFDGENMTQLVESNPALYGALRGALDGQFVTLPPGPAVAGVYATVDRTRGVWQSPGNVSLAGVRDFAVEIDRDLNDHLNLHPSGKSINALRSFTGRGAMVWGARTLAGNDNNWRYASVRRFFNMAEESCKKATFAYVFEPNTAATWAKVKGMIENFLTVQWRNGALAGAQPADAFYVRVGLGQTMTAQDVLDGVMTVEIGMAVIRPAEFIVLQFSHKRPQA